MRICVIVQKKRCCCSPHNILMILLNLTILALLIVFWRLSIGTCASSLNSSRNFSKVIVPSVYREWEHRIPSWASESEQQKSNYTVFVYQKLNSSAPNFISTNRGTEAGVYLRYIVDHYDTFPDIAVFVHAQPEVHVKGFNWLDMVKCVRPDATFINFNTERLCRHSSMW